MMRSASVAGKKWWDIVRERGQTRYAPPLLIPAPVAGSTHALSELTTLCCSDKLDHIMPIPFHLTPSKRSLQWPIRLHLIFPSPHHLTASPPTLALAHSTSPRWPLCWSWSTPGILLAQTIPLIVPCLDTSRLGHPDFWDLWGNDTCPMGPLWTTI